MFYDFVIFPFSKSQSSELSDSRNIRITDLLFYTIQTNFKIHWHRHRNISNIKGNLTIYLFDREHKTNEIFYAHPYDTYSMAIVINLL